jgi:hypothetical protein
MGQEASRPQPGKKLQVIGAGLPRTGTTSFSQALSILLDGPVYHCGTQVSKGESYNIKTWTRILKHTPIRSAEDEAFVMRELSQLMDGYVAVTDTPACVFVPELIKLYPEAKVICTVRDADKWAESLDKTASNAQVWFLGVVLMFNNPVSLLLLSFVLLFKVNGYHLFHFLATLPYVYPYTSASLPSRLLKASVLAYTGFPQDASL